MPYTLVIQTEVNQHAVLVAPVPAADYAAVAAAGGVLVDDPVAAHALADHASDFDDPADPAPTASRTDLRDDVCIGQRPLAVPTGWLAAMARLIDAGHAPGTAFELAVLTARDPQDVWPSRRP